MKFAHSHPIVELKTALDALSRDWRAAFLSEPDTCTRAGVHKEFVERRVAGFERLAAAVGVRIEHGQYCTGENERVFTSVVRDTFPRLVREMNERVVNAVFSLLDCTSSGPYGDHWRGVIAEPDEPRHRIAFAEKLEACGEHTFARVMRGAPRITGEPRVDERAQQEHSRAVERINDVCSSYVSNYDAGWCLLSKPDGVPGALRLDMAEVFGELAGIVRRLPVTALVLENRFGGKVEQVLGAGHFSFVRELYFGRGLLTRDDIASLAGHPSMRGIKVLDISRCRIKPEDYTVLLEATELFNLKDLKLGTRHRVALGAQLESSDRFRGLRASEGTNGVVLPDNVRPQAG